MKKSSSVSQRAGISTHKKAISKTRTNKKKTTTNKRKKRQKQPKQQVKMKKKRRIRERKQTAEVPRKRKQTTLNTKNRKQTKNRSRKKIRKFLLEIGLSVLITVLIVCFLSIFFFTIKPIEGYSMIPTLRGGDYVFIKKQKKYKTFDLVYIQHRDTKKQEIRRIIGCPGDNVQYEEDQLLINGESKIEYFIADEKNEAELSQIAYTQDFSLVEQTGTPKIPEAKYFVLGDNRPYTTDSRDYGLIDKSEIIGVVKMRIWPLHMLTGY